MAGPCQAGGPMCSLLVILYTMIYYTCGFPAGTFFCFLVKNIVFHRDCTFFFCETTVLQVERCRRSLAKSKRQFYPSKRQLFPSKRQLFPTVRRASKWHFVKRQFLWKTVLFSRNGRKKCLLPNGKEMYPQEVAGMYMKPHIHE